MLATVIAVFCKDEILLLKRGKASKHQGWCLPGGHVDDNEKIKDGAIRELKEETGIEIRPDRLNFAGMQQSIDKIDVAVFWISLKEKPDVILSPEHDDFMWGNSRHENLSGNTEKFMICAFGAFQFWNSYQDYFIWKDGK